MNEANQRFVISCEIVFTTQQEMDEADAQHYFELELAEQWEGLHDLDFESVVTQKVEKLPADRDEYNELNLNDALERTARAAMELGTLGERV